MLSKRVATASWALAAISLAIGGCGGQQFQALQPESNVAHLGADFVPGQLLVGHKSPSSSLGVKVLSSSSALGISLVTPRDGESLEDVEARLSADPTVTFVEPNWKIPAPQVGLGSTARRITAKPIFGFSTNDPVEAQQWHISKIKVEQAWSVSRGDGVTVAVIDTGVDPNHPDLRANLVPGTNTLENNNDPTDDNGHGTHVSGIIAALAGNGIGGVGVAPNAKIMPIRALGENGGSAQSVSAALQFAADHGASVVNMSLGSPQPSKAIQSAVNYAIRKGVTVVVAMGNDGDQGNPKQYPASYPGVIAVGATDPNDQATAWSDYGPWEAVSAPGYGIWSTFPTYECGLLKLAKDQPGALPPEDTIQLGYSAISGTSQASPVVAGVVALLRSKAPNLSPAQIRQDLMSTARSVGSGGFDPRYGAGIVDALAAVSGS